MTTFEFDILETLMRAAGRVVSRDDLMEELYGRKATPFDRSVDMHISHLRKKLEGDKPLIKTVRGVGYQFVRSPEEGVAALEFSRWNEVCSEKSFRQDPALVHPDGHRCGQRHVLRFERSCAAPAGPATAAVRSSRRFRLSNCGMRATRGRRTGKLRRIGNR